MLDAIREFFNQHIGSRAERAGGHTIEIAAAALLLEMASLDSGTEPAEFDAVLRAVQTKFGLTPDEARSLVGLAEREAHEATGLYPFTSLINRQFSAEQKERLIEALWRVAYADAELSAHEQHLMRRIADLLYVPHSTYIAAKLRARGGTS